MAKGQSLYDWCMENGEWGQHILFEFGNGNNSHSYINENGMTVTPHNFLSGSNKKVKWTCNKGHEWYAVIYSRVYNKRGCLSCSREIQSIRQKIPKQGINDLYTWCINNGEWGQQILYEFGDGNNSQKYLDEETRTYKSPHDFSYGSDQKIKWTCNKGHEWYADIRHRACVGRGCPVCSSTPKQGINDLYTWCINNGEFGQQLLSEFGDGNNSQSYINEQGNKVTPHDFTYGSGQKIKWTCSKGHEWYINAAHRTWGMSKCPTCCIELASIKQSTPKQGVNDLYTWCLNNSNWGQHLLQEFQGIDENGNKITPKEITYASNTKVLWKCNKGHEWYATNASRASYKSGCPYCNNIGTSYPEQFLYRAILQLYPNTISRGKYKGYEYDITIPEEKTCIEYSGINWHTDRLERDKIKDNICKEHNVRFIQIYAHYGERV